MWLSKPVYEILPYFYGASGLALLGAFSWVDDGYWPAFCLVVGLTLLVAGTFLWWKRRDFRNRH